MSPPFCKSPPFSRCPGFGFILFYLEGPISRRFCLGVGKVRSLLFFNDSSLVSSRVLQFLSGSVSFRGLLSSLPPSQTGHSILCFSLFSLFPSVFFFLRSSCDRFALTCRTLAFFPTNFPYSSFLPFSSRATSLYGPRILGHLALHSLLPPFFQTSICFFVTE